MSEHARSVVRTFQIFEALARARRPLSSASLAADLGAPRSSMADLLRTLVDLNLLAVDRRAATYYPTARFSALGTWLVQAWLGGEGLREALAELSATTGETVTLVVPADLEIEIVHAVGAPTGIVWSPEVGQRYSVFGTAVGQAYLATLPSSTVRAMHRRAVALKVQRAMPTLNDTLAATREARRRGYGWAGGSFHPEVSAMGAYLAADSLERPLFVSIGGPVRRMDAKRPELELQLREFMDQRTRRLRAARRR
jgi:IclR family transcriptional regulator, acetate operon repressor